MRWTALPAFAVTFGGAVLALLGVRAVWLLLLRWSRRRVGGPAAAGPEQAGANVC